MKGEQLGGGHRAVVRFRPRDDVHLMREARLLPGRAEHARAYGEPCALRYVPQERMWDSTVYMEQPVLSRHAGPIPVPSISASVA
ncbi:hypothetical protein ADK57_07155 [Streptomyces sp. MMG1533]|nr:hypothetical protein ADK57_07155 [Streptomyces sp. MMG1533]